MILHFAVRWESEDAEEVAQCKCCGSEIWRAARRLSVSVRLTNHQPDKFVPTGIVVCDSCYAVMTPEHAES